MNKKYLLGVDGGTEGIRAGIFDFSGTALAYASTTYPTQFPAPSWAEQDPDDWWDALGKSVRKAIQDSGIGVDQIATMAVDTTCCSVVALDASGNPVRPALIWMDVRSAEQAEQSVETGDVALRINSNGNGPVSAEWMIPKALWIKQNEPGIFEPEDFANEEPASASRSTTTTLQSSAIQAFTVAAPIPFAPPVTSTILSLSPKSMYYFSLKLGEHFIIYITLPSGAITPFVIMKQP